MEIMQQHAGSGIRELNAAEMELISGGNPAVAGAATVLIALGKSALEFGRDLGATAYRICH